jgi:hypothetical protein
MFSPMQHLYLVVVAEEIKMPPPAVTGLSAEAEAEVLAVLGGLAAAAAAAGDHRERQIRDTLAALAVQTVAGRVGLGLTRALLGHRYNEQVVVVVAAEWPAVVPLVEAGPAQLIMEAEPRAQTIPAEAVVGLLVADLATAVVVTAVPA